MKELKNIDWMSIGMNHSDDTEWLKAAACNPVFDFLKDPEEDIYSLEDGRPFHDDV
jgi:hypothetical protein